MYLVTWTMSNDFLRAEKLLHCGTPHFDPFKIYDNTDTNSEDEQFLDERSVTSKAGVLIIKTISNFFKLAIVVGAVLLMKLG